MNVVDDMFQPVVVKIAQIRSDSEDLPLVFIRRRAVDRGRAVDADVLVARTCVEINWSVSRMHPIILD